MKQATKILLTFTLIVLMITSSIPAFAGETQMLKVSGFDPNILYQEGSDVIIIRTTDLKTATEKYVYQVFGALSAEENNRIVQETMNYFSTNLGTEFQSNNDGKMIIAMYKQDSGDYIVYTRESNGFNAPSSGNANSYFEFLKNHPEVETIIVMGVPIYDKKQSDETNKQVIEQFEYMIQDPSFAPDGNVIFNNKPAQTYPINQDFFNPVKSPLGKSENSTVTAAPNTVPNNNQLPSTKPVKKPVEIVNETGIIDNLPVLEPSQNIQIQVKPDEKIIITETVIDTLKDNDSDILIKTESGKTKVVDTELMDKEVVIISTPKTDNIYPENEYIDLSNTTNESTPNIQEHDVIIVITDIKDEVIVNTPEIEISISNENKTKEEVILITKDEDKKTDADKIDPVTIIVIDNDRKFTEVTFKDTNDSDFIVVATEDEQSIYVPSSKNNPEGLIKAEIESGDTVSLWDKVDGSHIIDPVIKALYERGILKGYPDGTFGENQTITRAEASAMIYNTLANTDRIKNNSSTFKDIISGSWYSKYVLGNDAFKGYPDGNFKPSNNITREEMYSLSSKLTKLEDSKKQNSFISSDWSKESINKILNLGFISEVKPVKVQITRGEVFIILYKLISEDLEK